MIMVSGTDTPEHQRQQLIEWLQGQRVLASHQKVLLMRLLGQAPGQAACGSRT